MTLICSTQSLVTYSLTSGEAFSIPWIKTQLPLARACSRVVSSGDQIPSSLETKTVPFKSAIELSRFNEIMSSSLCSILANIEMTNVLPEKRSPTSIRENLQESIAAKILNSVSLSVVVQDHSSNSLSGLHWTGISKMPLTMQPFSLLTILTSSTSRYPIIASRALRSACGFVQAINNQMKYLSPRPGLTTNSSLLISTKLKL